MKTEIPVLEQESIQTQPSGANLQQPSRKSPKPQKTNQPLLYIMLSLISIMLIVMMVAGIWYVKHQETLYQNMVLTIDILTSNGEYTEAEIEAKRNQFRWDGISDALKKIMQGSVERDAIAKRRDEALTKTGIIIGRDSKDFEGQSPEKIIQDLIKRGFDDEAIRVTSYVVSPKEYKSIKEGDIIEVRINGETKFSQDKKFFPNSSIDIITKEIAVDSSTELEVALDENAIIVNKKAGDYKGLTLSEVKQQLLELGFNEDNISEEPGKTRNPVVIIKNIKNPDPIILKINIDGKDDFKADARFSPDAKIVLTYYKNS